MPVIKREYKLLVEDPRITQCIDNALISWSEYNSDEFKRRTPEDEKERIREMRKTRHQNNRQGLLDAIRSRYPEFADGKHEFMNYGRIQGLHYIILERKIEVIME